MTDPICINNIVRKCILQYLEPRDIKKLMIIDKSFELITEDPLFWETYLSCKNRNIPKRLPKVSTYYMDYYERKTEAKCWVNYMVHGDKHIHDPIYNYNIYDINPDIFMEFPKIRDEIMYGRRHCEIGTMTIFIEHDNFTVYFNFEGYEFITGYEQTIIVSEADMESIIAILLANNIRFNDKGNYGSCKLPWNIS